MGITVSIVEITPEIWADESFQKYISDGFEIGNIPEEVPEFRSPTVSDVEVVIEQMGHFGVNVTRTKHRIEIVFSKLIEPPLQLPNGKLIYDYLYHDTIWIILKKTDSPLSPETPVDISVDKGSVGERLDTFVQLLANRCGVFLILYDGEPYSFFVPKKD